ncbi:MAG: hypothetical protein R3E84_19370 [Pseudomonadales bacterium]
MYATLLATTYATFYLFPAWGVTWLGNRLAPTRSLGARIAPGATTVILCALYFDGRLYELYDSMSTLRVESCHHTGGLNSG